MRSAVPRQDDHEIRFARVDGDPALADAVSDALHAWERTPGFLTYLKESPRSRDAVRANLSRVLADARHRMLAALDARGSVLGTCLLLNASDDPVHGRTLEASLRTSPAAMGRGVSTKLLGRCVQEAFRDGACSAVEGWHSVLNPGSRRVFEKSGFGLAGFYENQTELVNIPGDGPNGGAMTHDFRWVLRSDGRPVSLPPGTAAAIANALAGASRALTRAA